MCYRRLGQWNRALAVHEIEWRLGYLDDEEDVRELARELAGKGIPRKAAAVLESEMDRGLLPRDTSSLRLLGYALLQAREAEEGAAALHASAKQSRDPRDHLRLASAYVELEQWRRVVEAALVALESDSPGVQSRAWFLLGMGYTGLGKNRKAKRAWSRAHELSPDSKPRPALESCEATVVVGLRCSG